MADYNTCSMSREGGSDPKLTNSARYECTNSRRETTNVLCTHVVEPAAILAKDFVQSLQPRTRKLFDGNQQIITYFVVH